MTHRDITTSSQYYHGSGGPGRSKRGLLGSQGRGGGGAGEAKDAAPGEVRGHGTRGGGGCRAPQVGG